MALPLCKCYCGKQVNTRKREFLPGHDAKLKSAMQRAYRTGTDIEVPPEYTADGERLAISPQAIANERGWRQFLTDGKETPSEEDPEEMFAGDRGELDPETLQPVDVQGFRPVRVKIGRWVYDANVVSYPDGPDGNTITVGYRDGKGEDQVKTVTRDKIVEG